MGLGLIPTYAAVAGYGIRSGFYLITTMNMFVPTFDKKGEIKLN